MVRWTRLLVTTSLALSVSTAAFASCLPAPSEEMAAKACCANGHRDCVPVMQAVDCCRSTAASNQRLTATKPLSAFKPILCLTEVALPPSLAAPSSTPSPIILAFVASSPPPFFLDSSLRI